MLYHVDVFMPAQFAEPCFNGVLKYTHHALRAAQTDKYGLIDLPESFDSSKAVLIESAVEDGFVFKQVWRQSYDDSRDLVIVVMSCGTVRTVWFNLNSDAHKTLNKSRYVPAPSTVRSTHQSNFKSKNNFR